MSLNQLIERWLVSRKKSFQSADRPFTTLAYAQGWDGSITTDRGQTVALSCSVSDQLTHQLRSLHDGILVGIETVLSDDPQLTVREWTGENPQPIILDSRLRMPLDSRLHKHPDKKCWLLTLEQGDISGHLKNLDHEIIQIPGEGNDFVPLLPALSLLREKGIESLMVEGGAKVITEFLRLGLADVIVMTMTPKLIGGYKAVGNIDIEDIALAPQILPINYENLGEDLIVWGDLNYSESGK
jgi:diaminohydroxyphosphoribosylaminopyrimidine deaminase/5-amino-6-(5-phosphoribosylamino)uracil reductase